MFGLRDGVLSRLLRLFRWKLRKADDSADLPIPSLGLSSLRLDLLKVENQALSLRFRAFLWW